MKKLNNCVIENCIPTPTSCGEWNGGDIAYLGICNGDSLNNVIWEIIGKLEDLAGEDLAEFELDTLLDICKQKAPLEINLISILTLLRDNNICLKDYIDTLNDKINELSGVSDVNVNLKCYSDFDNLGNQLKITRESLDQLVIDQLCNHDGKIISLEGKIVLLQQQINNIDINPSVNELSFATCIDTVIKPTSSQVKSIADELCDIETSHGTPAQVAIALSKTPTNLNAEFGLIVGWQLTPNNWAENYGNLLLEVENLRKRLNFIEDNCCASTCDDVKTGFSAVMNENFTGILLRFTSGAGTSIPTGWLDNGSTVIITDIDGNTVESNIIIINGAEREIITTGLNMEGDLEISVTAKMTNGVLTCEKCLFKLVRLPGCNFCTLTASGPVTIIYKTTINA